MRVSADKNDPGFENFNPMKYHYEVLLDGEPVSNCITADEENGFVLVYLLNGNGKDFILSEDKQSFLSGEKYGVVVIKTSEAKYGN